MSTSATLQPSRPRGDDHAQHSAAPTVRRLRIGGAYIGAVIAIYSVTAIAWLFLGAITEQRTVQRDAELRRRVGKIWGSGHVQVSPTLRLLAAEEQKAAAVAPAAKTRAGMWGQKLVVKSKSRSKSKTKVKAKAEAKAETKSKSKSKFKAKAKAKAKAANAATPIYDAKGQGKGEPLAPLPEKCRGERALAPRSTRARAHLNLEHRRKGLLWYATYRVRFAASYAFENPTPCERRAELRIALPSTGAAYDNFRVLVDGKERSFTIATQRGRSMARVALRVGANAKRRVELAYASRGLGRWSYAFGESAARARDFTLAVHTNFANIDFPDGTLAPTSKQRSDGQWKLTWRFGNLLSDSSIAVVMPKKLNPGPLSAQISRFAPVSLLFFFGILLLVSVLRDVPLHPVHYGMLAAAFFSFHLLLAYLVDQLPLWACFSIAAGTSVTLVVSYLRLAVGSRFALSWAAGSQLLYLVLFSLAFFLQGYTGLTITIFSVLTLFVVMQLTARIDWSRVFGSGRSGGAPRPAAAPPTTLGAPSTPAPATAPVAATPAVAGAYAQSGAFHDVE